MINKTRVIRLLQELIRIDSQNPPGNEVAIADFVARKLKNLKIPVKIYEFKNKRPNVIGVLKGKSTKKSLLITPHLDTVPAGSGWKFQPFSAALHRGRIYGLGATDCKVNLACALEALHSIVEDNKVLGYNLILAATADEETGSDLGLIPLLKKGILKPTQALILDADDFGIVVDQKGLMHIKIKIKGKRAHGAYPWLGINAIDIAIKIIGDFKKYKFPDVYNKYLKASTVNLGTIRGGDKVNIVPGWCEFELDIRTVPGVSQQKVLGVLKEIVRKHAKHHIIEIEGIQKPYSITSSHPLVEGLCASMRKLGLAQKIVGSEGATVITFFQEKNIPAVATGFGVAGCDHIIDEYVTVDNLYKGAKVLEDFLVSYKLDSAKY